MTNKLSAAIDSALKAFLAEVGRAVRESTPDLIIEAVIQKGSPPRAQQAAPPSFKYQQVDHAILDFVRHNPGAGYHDVVNGTKISRHVVRQRLKTLRSQGYLRSEGRTNACRYYVKR